MPSDFFHRQNARGLEGQNYVRDMLRSWGQTVEEAPDEYFAPWDLKTPFKKLEVKHDLKAHLTGNIALEPTALNHSEADILVYVTDHPRTCYFVPMQKARDFANQWEPKIPGGEFKLPICLVPRSIFIDRLKPVIITTPPQ